MTLIQIIGAFKKDANFAYTKKSFLLAPENDVYKDFSTKIGEHFTTTNMIKLIMLYKRAECDKKKSEDKKSPSPYYLLNFLGYYLNSKDINQQHFLDKVTIENLTIIYDFFKKLPSEYYEKYNKKHKVEYNKMIKQKVDLVVMKEVLDEELKSFKRYDIENYEKVMNAFNL